MATSFTVDLKMSGETITNVRWEWGTLYPEERRWQDGWGTAIEVPAVLEILDLISAGKITSGQARGLLAEAAEAVTSRSDRDYGDPEAEAAARCHGDCQKCQDREAEVRRDVAYRSEQSRKLRDPDYQYVLRGRIAHAVDCRHVESLVRVPAELSDGQFRTFLHEVVHYDWPVDVSYEPVTWEGLQRWCEANTGPQGGRYYRACKTCKIQLPAGY